MSEKTNAQDQTVTINSNLAEYIQEAFGENVYLCYQCVKCSSGCPVAEYFDWMPNQIMRALQLGQEDIVFQSQTPWLCASCQTCTTRCPQGLDIAGIMEFITREALARGYKPPVSEVKLFNEAFMREVRLWGRAYEPGLMAEIKLRKPDKLLDDLDLYTNMLKKRKVALLPSIGRPPRKVKPIPGANEAVAYYPGCSLHSTATEFDHSTKEVCKALDIQLIEPRGWVCCGSSAAHRSDPNTAVVLPMENLEIIERSGFSEVTMPCAACFNRHKAAVYEYRHKASRKTLVKNALHYEYQDKVEVNTLIQTIHKRVGIEGVREKVTNPLAGLKIVCYYGCLLTRPPEITEAESYENPTDMDEILQAAGAEVLDWSYKTTCCGAAHSLTRPDIVLDMSGNLIKQAQAAGAEAIAVACPLCHLNLDARQIQMELDTNLPVLYFTQLLALALGLSERDSALQKNMIDPRPWLKEKGILTS